MSVSHFPLTRCFMAGSLPVTTCACRVSHSLFLSRFERQPSRPQDGCTSQSIKHFQALFSCQIIVCTRLIIQADEYYPCHVSDVTIKPLGNKSYIVIHKLCRDSNELTLCQQIQTLSIVIV